jgi:hypothetical protein
MVWNTLEAKLSTPRMSRYLQKNQNKHDRAAEAYVHNMKIAESLVSIFHVLEVSLRNGIQKEMAIEYNRLDWYEEWNDPADANLQKLYNKIADAKRALGARRVKASPDNIVAELSFGFWTSLFNRATTNKLSKPLMRVFYSCPKSMRQPDKMRTRLNKGRDLRNRCFHHEPLLWQPLMDIHRDILEVVKWIDPSLHAWVQSHDRVASTVHEWMTWRDAPVPSPTPCHLQSAPASTCVAHPPNELSSPTDTLID